MPKGKARARSQSTAQSRRSQKPILQLRVYILALEEGKSSLRYFSIHAFEKHLTSAAPEHLSHFYLIATPDEYEQKSCLNSILSRLKTSFVTRLSAPSRSQIVEALCSQTLFGEEPVVVIEQADKKVIECLAEEKAIPFGYLLVTTHQKAFSKNFELLGIVLDLTEEKPWDREKRWTEMLIQRAFSFGKELSVEASSWMVEHLEPDCALLVNELEKVLSFCLEKKRIEQADVEVICVQNRSRSLWACADELVWDQVYHPPEEGVRDRFHAFLVLVRNQLALGSKMWELNRMNVVRSEWIRYFPKLRPKVLEKKALRAAQLGEDYFRLGIERLFQMDLLSKSSAVSVDVLSDLLHLYFR